jgi:hypothetical protein
MKCLDCLLTYTEQKAEHSTPEKKNIQAFKNNNSNSGYSNHILNTGHKYGTITGTINIIRTQRKGKHFNTQEKYHIYITKIS